MHVVQPCEIFSDIDCYVRSFGDVHMRFGIALLCCSSSHSDVKEIDKVGSS